MTPDLERAGELTMKLLERRAQLRTIWGAEYEKKIEPARAAVRREMLASKNGAVLSAMRLGVAAREDHPEIPLLPVMLMAASVDVVEAGAPA